MGTLEKIMQISDHSRRAIELRKYAKSLGCTLHGTYTDGIHIEQEVISRIREAEVSQRGHRMWITALVSAIASAISALAAWAAILYTRSNLFQSIHNIPQK